MYTLGAVTYMLTAGGDTLEWAKNRKDVSAGGGGGGESSGAGENNQEESIALK